MIAIIDYGMGNIHSVKKALDAMGAKTVVTNKAEDIKKAAKVVLPGVGAFGDAMAEIEKQGLSGAVEEHIKAKKIFLGICLGMHMLFDSSEESPKAKGLGILRGTVKKFDFTLGLKIPHMGWNQIKIRKMNCPVFNGLKDGSSVYFCHSYYPQPAQQEIIAASTEYGRDFASIIWQDNIFAMQFHPEKSQAAGLKMLENFLRA
ncbi:MAG: imidazole glycerol phosphate synthase subunit HisH [Candidatus Omnitrophica bacterium]|nr:imidazole glycerol phosphate synthase subunit HisH [Candidatus Omnitrophota bacterium]MDD5078875.1 imidazole glycerol phosphate synthase subunit HisH [Candidatus Omnitrophota bacterium]